MKRLTAITLMLSLIVFGGCGGGGGGPKSYAVTASAGTGGSVSPSSATVTEGATTSISITLNEGYEIAEVTGCGGTISGTTYTTGPIVAACSISATFRLKKYTVTATAGNGGTVTPASTIVEHGSRATFTLATQVGYEVANAAGCGGTLTNLTYTSGILTGPCSVTVEYRRIPLFSSATTLLPDLSYHYLSLCTNRTEGPLELKRDQPNIQSGAIVNFSGHTDGRKDLVFTMWCGVPGGTVISGPTPNGGVVFQQDKNGNFSDATRKIFGTDLIEMAEGVAWKPVVWDANGDGYDEVIWPVQGEDGRAQQPVYRQFVFLTSQGNGAYEKTLKGSLKENAGWVSLYPNELGSFDVATTNNFWRWSSGWQESSGFSWYKIGTTFLARRPGELSSTRGTRPNGPTFDRGPSIGLWKRDATTGWSEEHFFEFPSRSVPFITWRKEQGSIDLFTIDGRQYIYGNFERNCELSDTVTGERRLFVLFNASRLDSPYQEGSTLIEGQGTTSVVIPLLFDISSSRLLRVTAIFRNWNEEVSPFDLVCNDFDGDGNRDVLVLPGDDVKERAKPHLYLHVSKDIFAAVDRSFFPTPIPEIRFATALYRDVDGDGFRDLVYWPLNINKIAAGQSFRLPLHKGRRNVSLNDLK